MTENRERMSRLPRPAHRRLRALSLVLGLALGATAPAARGAHPEEPARRPFASRGAAAPRGKGLPGSSGGWWLGTAGVALALAAFGAVSLASKRYLPQGPGGPLRVVGRTSLSPRQTVYLLQVGDRVLIVGAGTQGAPSLLGELDDPEDIERLISRKSHPGPASALRTDHPAGGDA